MIEDVYGSRYAIVKDDLTIDIVSTEHEAILLSEDNNNAFFARIGCIDDNKLKKLINS